MSTLIIQSLAWALLHSIWQIALIAGLLYVLLNRISGRMAAHRYLLSFGALTLSFLAALLTFSAYFFAPSAAVYAVPGDLATVFDLPVEALAAYQLGKPMGLLETIEMWVQTNSGWIALAWSVGILALSLYYAVGLIWSKLIRHYRTKHLDTAHFQQWQQIYSLSGMRKYIEIKQSFLVKGPLTVGHVKPIILVPIGFFTMLSPSQVEAILLHELAHIRRHDYLFNLVQVFIKLVLFYHPATWFICRCIDTEREHACDDLAMSSFADPKAYVRALGLLRIQFFNQKNQWAMHFYQQEPAFLARLKRLANPTAHSTSKRKTGTLIVPICLIVLGGVFVSFKEQAPQAAILPDFGIEGPVSIDQMQMDTIIPEEEVEEIVEKPSATQFPIVVEEEPPVIVEGTPSEKGNQVKELFKLQYQIAQQKRELEA
ncbi:MAG: M56 family metallopeptidase, partial [Bacteroidota bacterium]